VAGVTAWHVENKEMLHGLMSRAIFRACLEAIPTCSDWRQWLREFGLSLWRAQQATPDIRQLIVMAPIDAEAREQTRARIIAELAKLGLHVEVAAIAQHSIQALVTGWTTLRMGSARQKNSSQEWFLQSLDVLIDGWTARTTAHAVGNPRGETLL
jgi:TetR/AcrR family tetracycline transcriptional repressor